jgi:hypothetical protein
LGVVGRVVFGGLLYLSTRKGGREKSKLTDETASLDTRVHPTHIGLQILEFV